jgi:Flp pilus assembly pilin Flp
MRATRPLKQALRVNQGAHMRRLTDILRCERGANAIEYAFVASLIAVAAIAGITNLGTRIDIMYSNVSNHL